MIAATASAIPTTETASRGVSSEIWEPAVSRDCTGGLCCAPRHHGARSVASAISGEHVLDPDIARKDDRNKPTNRQFRDLASTTDINRTRAGTLSRTRAMQLRPQRNRIPQIN